MMMYMRSTRERCFRSVVMATVAACLVTALCLWYVAYSGEHHSQVTDGAMRTFRLDDGSQILIQMEQVLSPVVDPVTASVWFIARDDGSPQASEIVKDRQDGHMLVSSWNNDTRTLVLVDAASNAEVSVVGEWAPVDSPIGGDVRDRVPGRWRERDGQSEYRLVWTGGARWVPCQGTTVLRSAVSPALVWPPIVWLFVCVLVWYSQRDVRGR